MSQTDCLGNFTSAQHCPEFHATWSYLRPGGGMSIIPWLLVVAILVVHIPVVIVRIVRWESGQVWSLALAAFAITLTTLAYRSTEFDPQQIYVWTPLPLIIDVGAMIQLFALILEKREDVRRIRKTIRRWSEIIGGHIKLRPNRQGSTTNDFNLVETTAQRKVNGEQEDGIGIEEIVPLPPASPRDVRGVIIILVLSALFGLILIILQLIGFAKAIHGYHSSEPLLQSWCATTFKVAKQVLDTNCNYYNVSPSQIGAADCIQLPGNQPIWLKWTAIGIGVGIACEIVDAMIIIRVGKEGSKKRRPWSTMVLGITIWALFIGLGVTAGGSVPLSNPEVLLVRRTNSSTCLTNVVPARLWGQLLSWEEGLLSSLGASYLPKPS